MRRIVQSSWAAWALAGLSLPLAAQPGVTTVRIQSSPAGAPFYIDGTRYVDAVTLPWVTGSRHTLDAVSPSTPLQLPVEYAFVSWGDSKGLWSATSSSVTVTASPTISQYTVTYNASYRVQIDIPDPAMGSIKYNSQDWNLAVQYFTPGTELLLQATPQPGWLFSSWGPEFLPFGPSPHPGQIRVKVDTPLTLRPWFGRARVVAFDTVPAGLNVYIDRSLSPTPTTRDWAFGGQYPLSAPDAQQDKFGQWWMFDSWSSGGAQTHVYTVTEAGNFGLTASFKRGYQAIFETSPYGLRLNIDGRENWPTYLFTWAVDSVKKVVAPLEQVDASGRRWRFVQWEHGGEAAQSVTVKGDLRWKAVYERQPRLTVESVPTGLSFTVDGQLCRTPCQFDRAPGTVLSIAASPTIPLTADSRLELSAGSSETVTLTADQRLRFTYVRAYRLSTAVQPEGSGTVEVTPAPAGGFLPENTPVIVRAIAEPGFRHVRWEGDYPIAVTAPRSTRAVFEKTPWVAKAGNAAGPDTAGQGGRIAITGLNLAPLEAVATSQSPLPQTLGGVVVMWEDQMLPLVSVSPTRIEAVLPWAIPEGTQALRIKQQGQADTLVPIEVATVGPGLYETFSDLGDGTLLLRATGVGPSDPAPWDGFPAQQDNFAVYPIDVLVNGEPVRPLSASLSRTEVGIAQIRVTATLAPGTTFQLRVNGRASNVVTLPQP